MCACACVRACMLWQCLIGLQVDAKDVVIPHNICQMIEQLLHNLNITPIPQVPLATINNDLSLVMLAKNNVCKCNFSCNY